VRRVQVHLLTYLLTYYIGELRSTPQKTWNDLPRSQKRRLFRTSTSFGSLKWTRLENTLNISY